MSKVYEFSAYAGHALDLGTFTISPSDGDLAGSRAIVRAGSPGAPALLELESDNPPEEGLITWNPGTGALSLDLAASQVDALEVAGRASGQLSLLTIDITIEKADGTRLKGPRISLRIFPTVGDI